MAETRITNVVVPEVFNPYVLEASLQLNRFWRSGVLVADPRIDAKLGADGGRTFNMPTWQDPNDTDEVPTEAGDATVNPIAAVTEVAVRQFRILAWGANDMSAVLAGANPMQAVAQYVANNWATRFQANLVAIMQGVIADNVAADSSDMINDVAIEDGVNATDTALIDQDKVVDTMLLLGDKFEGFSTIVMHSAVYKRLIKQNFIDFTPQNIQNVGFGVYLGLSVIVDDAVGKTAGGTSGYKYETYIIKPGALSFGQSTQGYLPTETDRVPLQGGGIDQLITRRVFAIHPKGFAYLSPGIAGEFPINTELDDAASWNRVAQGVGNVGFVVLQTNG